MQFLEKEISRKEFLKKIFQIIAGLNFLDFVSEHKYTEAKEDSLKEAYFYKKLEDSALQCEVCFRQCILKDGQRSFCRNKINRKGVLYSLVYAKPSAVHIDPIEKEPVYHFLPGSKILCFGTAGCNFRCKFCHNWHLSQRSIEEMEYSYNLSPWEAVEFALKKEVPSISFTYNEPTSFFEYVYDIAKYAKQRGIRIIFHTNGGINPQPLKELLEYTDAVTVDLKGFREEFYKEVSEAKLEPVLRTLKIIKEKNRWLEIVNLVIPTLNDDLKDIKDMCKWIKENLGADTPLHFSRFFPNYKLTNLAPTPISTLEKAYETAKEVGLNFVSIGNVPGHKYNSTFCPKCNKIVIQRVHFSVLANNIIKGKCKFCGQEIPGVWS